jgi:hypothetical protein
MTSDLTLSISTVTHIINAPLEKVDIADWLFNLPDAEYQRCSRAHIGAGTTRYERRVRGPGVEVLSLGLNLRRYHPERTY